MNELESFEAAVGALRDNISTAMAGGRIGTVVEGLAAYRSVLLGIADHGRILDGQRTGDPDQSSASRWPEWEHTLRDVSVVVDTIGESGSKRAWVELIRWCRQMVVELLGQGDELAANQLARLFEQMWRIDLDVARPDREARQESLLLRVSEIVAFQSHRSGRGGAEAERLVARVFLHMIRDSIDATDEDSGLAVVRYFEHAFFRSTAERILAQVALVLDAWILLGIERHDRVDMPMLRASLNQLVPYDLAIVDVLEETAAEDKQTLSAWHWWEMNGRGPMQSGIMQLPTYLDLATVFLCSDHALRGRGRGDISRWTAERLITVIDGLAGRPRLAELSGRPSPQRMQLIRGQFVDIVETARLEAERALAETALEPARVATFIAAIADELALLRPASLAQRLATEAFAMPSGPPTFGVDRLAPRSYFVEDPVIADPDDFGRDVVRSIVRGEENLIIDALLPELASVESIGMDELVGTLRDAVRRTNAAPLLITNSYAAAIALGGDPHARAYEEAAAEFEGAPLIRTYDSRAKYVVIVFGRGLVEFGEVVSLLESDQIVGQGALAVAATALDNDEVLELLHRSERTGLEAEKIRSSVRVRVQERIDIIPTAVDVTAYRLHEDEF